MLSHENIGSTKRFRHLQFWATIGLPFAFLPIDALASQNGPTLDAKLDRDVVSLDEEFEYTLNARGGSASSFRLPTWRDFEVREGARSNHMQIINGRASSETSQSYWLRPKNIGTFTLNGATAVVNGRRIQAPSLRIRVDRSAPKATLGDTMFTTTDVDKTQVYVGEQVVYTFRFFRRVNLHSATFEQPSFDGFVAKPLGEQKNYARRHNGREYSVTEINFALFPQKPGDLIIGQAKLPAEVDAPGAQRPRSGFGRLFDRGRTQTVTLSGEEVLVRVRALPPPPANFSGLVGEFTVSAKASQDTVVVGQSTELSLKFSGFGNVHQLPEPAIDKISGAKLYPEKSEQMSKVEENRLYGSIERRFVFVPTTPGTLILPEQSLVYFDTKQKKYQERKSPSFELAVTGRAEAIPPPVVGTIPALRTETDTQPTPPIITQPDALRPTPFFLLGSLTLIALLTAVTLGIAPLIKIQRSKTGMFKEAIAALEHAAERKSPPEKLARSYRRVLSVFLGFPAGALTAQESERELTQAGVDTSVAERISKTLASLDHAVYGQGHYSLRAEHITLLSTHLGGQK